MVFTRSLAASLLLASGVLGATRNYDFTVEWMNRSPDGYSRPVQGINGQWPIPPIMADVGDTVIIDVHNKLGNASAGLHFHGLYQNGTSEMDGSVGITQCSIPPGASFRYNFNITQPGTYWYHSHVNGQYPDGMRGPLIVNDPKSPYKDQYSEEIVITLSDWYHDQMVDLIRKFLSVTNPTGAEPVPEAALMNDTQNLKVPIQPGKTYMLRIINMAAFAAQYFWIEGHTMRIIEVDGVYTDAAEADMIYLTAAQRCSVLVTTKNETGANFPIVGSMDQDLFDKVPDGLNPNVTGWLVYDDKKAFPKPKILDEFKPFDDFTLVPYDKMPLLDKVDHSIQLDVKMDNLGDGANYAFFNDITFVNPKVPTLYTVLTTGKDAMNPLVYGSNSNARILKKGEVVEIILNNMDPGKHPFHLHGHDVQVAVRADEELGMYNGTGSVELPAIPMRRDVIMVRPNSNMVLRFVADNPDKSPIPSTSSIQ